MQSNSQSSSLWDSGSDEAALLHEETKQLKQIIWELNSIIENSYDAIVVTDNTGKVLRVNNSYERISGIKAAELLGKNMSEVVREGIISESVTVKVLEKKALGE